MFIRKVTAKNKDGSKRVYAQLAESVRINGKPRHRVIATIGRIDSTETEEKMKRMAESLIKASGQFEVLNIAQDLKAYEGKQYGPFLIFRKLFKSLGFEKILSTAFKDLGTEFDVLETIFNLMLNRLTNPCSKKQMTLWEQSQEGIEKFEEHQYYRAMDYLVEHKDEIETSVFFNMRDLFHTELDIALFDTTTLVYYGDGDHSEVLLNNGFSKAHRGDLKQVVVGVLMSKEGIPLGHEVFEGNQNDVTRFEQIIDKIKNKYQIRKVILVGDRGMISKKNINHLQDKGYEYILGYRMRTISKDERKKVLSQANLKKLRSTKLEYKEVKFQNQRLIVCYNPERAEKDKEHREREIEKLRKKIVSGDVKNLISNPFFKRFVKGAKDKPKIDEEKIKADELYDGVFVLTTNTKLSGPQVVSRYRDLWQVEYAFRQLKSELDMGPIRHWKDNRIRAHIMICFMAFCLKVEFYKKLKDADDKFCYIEGINHLKSLQAIEVKLKKKKVKLRTEPRDEVNFIFRTLGIRLPNRILKSEINETVVIRH